MIRNCVRLAAVAAAAWSGSALVASAQSFDGAWKGQMTCAKLSFAKGTQKVPLTLSIAGGKATFTRDVYSRDNTKVVGTEHGSGTIASDGAVTLASTYKGPNPEMTYTASYTGSIKGSAASLSGTQVWTYKGKTENRPCTIALSRGQ